MPLSQPFGKPQRQRILQRGNRVPLSATPLRGGEGRGEVALFSKTNDCRTPLRPFTREASWTADLLCRFPRCSDESNRRRIFRRGNRVPLSATSLRGGEGRGEVALFSKTNGPHKLLIPMSREASWTAAQVSTTHYFAIAMSIVSSRLCVESSSVSTCCPFVFGTSSVVF